LNRILGIGFALHFCEISAALWLEARVGNENPSFLSWKKYATWREAVALSDCEFLGSENWHTLALRAGVPNTSIDRRIEDKGG
jgi:hypothetical protein